MSDLLHEALNRQANITHHHHLSPPSKSPPLPTATGGASSYSSRLSDAGSDDGDVFTPVHTRPTSPTGSHTPRSSSHHRSDAPTSPTLGAFTSSSATIRSTARTPTGSRPQSRSSSPSRLAKKRMQEELEKKTSKDPLRRFENEISSRIFKELSVIDLARCMRVCKRWNRSATINWCWYLRFQEERSTGPLNTEPIWTRRESKENWAHRFRSAFTLNGLQYQTVFEQEYEKARSDGYLTPKEEREARWADEAASTHTGTGSNLHTVFGGDKLAAREFYKSLGGRTKMKGGGRLGTSSPGIRDRTAYGDSDGFYD